MVFYTCEPDITPNIPIHGTHLFRDWLDWFFGKHNHHRSPIPAHVAPPTQHHLSPHRTTRPGPATHSHRSRHRSTNAPPTSLTSHYRRSTRVVPRSRQALSTPKIPVRCYARVPISQLNSSNGPGSLPGPLLFLAWVHRRAKQTCAPILTALLPPATN